LLKVDLHLHTTCSDGVFSPEQLVHKAKAAGLNIISVTDHDSLCGLKKAIEVGKQIGVEVIPGLEISTDIEDKEVHILAYFVDIENAELQNYLKFFREERLNRAFRIVKKLNNLGYKISFDSVLNFSKDGAVGRPHIAQALVEAGYANNFFEAFDKFIGNHCPAFERKVHVSPQSALKIINDANGLSFIAHPGNIDEKILLTLIKYGLDGIEVIHPSHSNSQINFYKGIANQYYMLTSGGSDFHGGKRDDEQNLGKYYISYSEFESIRKTALNRN